MESGSSESGSRVELEFVKNSRKYYRAKVTRIQNFVNDNINNMTLESKYEYIEELNNLKSKLQKYNEEFSNVLRKLNYEVKDLESELESCDDYDSRCSLVVRSLESMVRATTDGHPSPSPPSFRVSASSNLRLPVLPLPKFGNRKGECYELFMENFEAIISKHNLGSLEKYMYLEAQLDNEPLTLVKSLGREARSFDSAKCLLEKAFSSPVKQKYQIIEQMTALKLSEHGDPYRFISDVNTISDQIAKHNLDINSVFQYFLWHGLNDEFKRTLVTITNKTYPSLDEIKDNLFNATDRYLITVREGFPSRTKSSEESSLLGMATNVKYNGKPKFKPCILCNPLHGGVTIDHPIFKCTKFPTSASKIDRLKIIKACVKCGNENHSAQNCLFKFKRNCSFCRKQHFDFLCYKRDKVADKLVNASENDKYDLVSSSISVNSAVLNFEDSKLSIVPTFSFITPNGNTLRAMKDLGSQASFILSEVAMKENFPVVARDVSLSINGFNSSRKVKTNVVRVTASFGSVKQEVLAVCVPKINTKITLPGLSRVAEQISNKCGALADVALLNGRDTIENLDFVLGCNGSHCVPMKEVVFGGKLKSSYFETPVGIMLAGSVRLLDDNLKFLDYIRLDSTDCFNNSKFDYVEPDVECSFDVNHVVLDDSGKLITEKLDYAVKEVIELEEQPLVRQRCSELCEVEKLTDESESLEDQHIINKVLNNTSRMNDGRIVMPLMWNENYKGLLGRNFNLAKQILLASLRKLKKNKDQFKMIHEVIDNQRKMGVIEPIENLDSFIADFPESCFLAHMPVFRHDKDTTKCRVVFLSNLAGKDVNKSFVVEQSMHDVWSLSEQQDFN